MAGKSFKVSFVLDEADANYFRSLFRKAKKVAASQDQAAVLSATKSLVANVRSSKKTPNFVLEAIAALEDLTQIIEDKDYGAPQNVVNQVVAALAYFANPEDLIPDHLPGLGFIDDAIYVEIVIRELQAEIESYEEFCAFRSAEENRRKENGQDTHVKRDEWLADKRTALHKRMRRSGGVRGWHLRW